MEAVMVIISLTVALIVIFDVTNVSCLEAGVSHIYPDLYDKEVVFAVSAINRHMRQHGDDAAPRSAIRILSATAQVTDGIVYKYEIEVANGTIIEMCRVTVESTPWVPSPNIRATEIDCIHSEGMSPLRPESQSTATTTPTTTTTTAEPTNSSYPPLVMDIASKSALLYFVEMFNAPRNVHYRYVPYDVTVERGLADGGPFLFKFSLRMTPTLCFKPDLSLFGKITLDECPPLNKENLIFHGPKCLAEVSWNPTAWNIAGIPAEPYYKFKGFTCPGGL